MANNNNTPPAATVAAAFGFDVLPTGYYSAAEIAAHYSGDKHSCFLMDTATPGDYDNYVLLPDMDQSWATFVPMAQVAAADYNAAETNGWFMANLLAQHATLGNYSVTWASHLEGRGPCFVQVLQLGNRNAQAQVFSGPAEGGTLQGLLAELVSGGLWHCCNPQYSGLPVD